ncbi:hypothetical protein Tco_0540233 [Tanacetum coccineum]
MGGNRIIFADFLKDDPYSRRFDEYKEEFANEIEQLANEYDLRGGKKIYALDDVWEKCEKFHDTAYPWHNEGLEEEEQWESGIEKIDYKPPLLDDALPLGRFNGSRFMGMIRKEMDEKGRTIRKTFSQQGIRIRGLLDSLSCGK